MHHWWWDRDGYPDPADWFEDPRDQPESPSFERRIDEDGIEEWRIDCRFDEEAEDRIARGRDT